MEKKVLIDGVEVKLKSSAALPRIYRVKFGRDLFSDFYKIQKDAKKNDDQSVLPASMMEIFENIAYLMARHADPSQPDSIEEWLGQFSNAFSIYKILPDVMEMWAEENKQTVTAKKKDEPLTEE